MKIPLLAIAIALALTTTVAAADIAGKWSGTMTGKNDQGEQNSRPVRIQFQQDGDKWTGTGGPSESEPHEFSNVKVEGNVVTFEVPGDSLLKVRLVLEGDTLKGNLKGMGGDGAEHTMDLAFKRDK